MFSRSHHHDQKVPIGVGAPPTPLSSQIPLSNSLGPFTALSAHHCHLESLLNSALATLMIILDATATPTVSDHTTEVLQALCRRTLATAPADLLPPSTLSPADPPTQKMATYADVTSTATRPIEPPSVPTVSAPKTPRITRPPRNNDPNSVPDIVFRFDLHHMQPATRAHPSVLFDALSTDPNVRADGVRWTRGGNLTVKYRDYQVDEKHDQNPGLPDGYTQRNRLMATWLAVCPALGLPKSPDSIPRVDHGIAWHSVVVHDVPAPQNDDESDPHTWLRDGGFLGKIKGFARMCSDRSQANIPFRISLAFKADADFLVKNGALMFGSRCRVSHLTPTLQLQSQTP
ncbi:hypothetical protein B0H16DRAFT_1727934 [Mycena metata]|uniref:Uncharacterized protein n=1 Tax=Mycena metata TaxID=1033252 RepID=A0AAD7IJF4_9AGAR|nr:hypothetical protein B0H16DRAFT_1727934 [Mycena metata]